MAFQTRSAEDLRATEDGPSLPGFLASLARDLSDTTLATAFTIGFNVALTAIVWNGPGWVLLSSAGASFFAFGLWGIADRELAEAIARDAAPRGPRWLKIARITAVAIGALAFPMFFLAFLGLALGRLIS